MTVLYLFDIDGTLLHAHGSGRDAFDAAFSALHGIESASDGISYGGKTDGQLVDEIAVARLGRHATPAEHTAFLDVYLPLLREQVTARGVQVLEGVIEALEWLAARPDVVIGVATGNVRAGAEVKLTAAKLDRWFAFGGYACDSPLRSELVARGIERGREQREVREVVVVGDTVHDIAAARACGATICAVTTGGYSAEKLADADAVWSSLAELPAWHARRFG